MAEKIPGELHFDENSGSWTLHEGKSEKLCRDGKPHRWDSKQEICRTCGITRMEYVMRYGP